MQSETVLIEIVAADGRPSRPGDSGRIVATPLHNGAMPLIRLDTGLVGEVGPPCPCGRGLPVLARIAPA